VILVFILFYCRMQKAGLGPTAAYKILSAPPHQPLRTHRFVADPLLLGGFPGPSRDPS
jgi:hypothetical protein